MLDQLIEERKKKLQAYAGDEYPYPHSSKRTHRISDAILKFQELALSSSLVTLTGRVLALRDQGKIFFLDLADASSHIQLILSQDDTQEFLRLTSALDIGDIVEMSGVLMLSKRGERSLRVQSGHLLAKSIRPWPSSFYGIENEEERLRKRYLEFALDPQSRDLFLKKSKFWSEVRTCMLEHSFLEVEMPILESVPGGAETEPFLTHHNALDTDFYLRISLELPLKKLLVGGFEKVFELGRVFRNEGIDREHLQDYTAMEYYWAYEDYEAGMEFVEAMYKRVIAATCGSLTTISQGNEVDWGKKWPKVEYYDLFKEYAKLDLNKVSDEELRKKAFEVGAHPESSAGRGRLIDLVYKKTARPHLIEPCFLVNPPVEIEPLAKRHRLHEGRVERFQILAAGSELGKGFTELNDPFDQRARFEEQMRLRESGDKEAQMIDEAYLEAMEYGMPPNTGFGMAERLFSVLMDKPIRECTIFPLMRPER